MQPEPWFYKDSGSFVFIKFDGINVTIVYLLKQVHHFLSDFSSALIGGFCVQFPDSVLEDQDVAFFGGGGEVGSGDGDGVPVFGFAYCKCFFKTVYDIAHVFIPP